MGKACSCSSSISLSRSSADWPRCPLSGSFRPCLLLVLSIRAVQNLLPSGSAQLPKQCLAVMRQVFNPCLHTPKIGVLKSPLPFFFYFLTISLFTPGHMWSLCRNTVSQYSQAASLCAQSRHLQSWCIPESFCFRLKYCSLHQLVFWPHLPIHWESSLWFTTHAPGLCSHSYAPDHHNFIQTATMATRSCSITVMFSLRFQSHSHPRHLPWPPSLLNAGGS